MNSRRLALESLVPGDGTHAGLWLDRYLHSQRDPADPDDAAGKDRARLLVDTLTRHARVPPHYAAAVERRERLLRTLDGRVEGGCTRLYTAETMGRLVIGIGRASVLETSLTLDHTWGTPLIPGSALKGITAHVAQAHGGPGWVRDGEAHRILFGTQSQAGLVTFHDAWWLPEGDRLPLHLDVMAVHHREWYSALPRAADAGPCDWDEPVPVSFVTARGRFLVALSGPPEWVDVAAAMLADALDRHGVGAKTRSGYGRMRLEPRLSDAEREAGNAVRRLDELPASFRGAGNADEIFARFEALAALEPPADALRRCGAALYQAGPKAWRAWRQKPGRSDEQRVLFDRWLTPPDVPEPSGPARPAPSDGPTLLEALAWIGGNPKKPELCVRVGDTRLKAIKLVNLRPPPDGNLKAALRRATEQQPVQVVVETDPSGKKPRSVRLRGV